MVNEEKVKIMNRLAMYEHGEGRKYLPVSRYYRSDYIGLALIRNFFLVTIGYILGLAGVAAYFSEYLMDNVNKINLVEVGIYIIVGYLIVLVVYSILTYIQYSVKSGQKKVSGNIIRILQDWKKSTGGRKKEIRSGEMQEDIENDSFT